jgi:hypothetical protein
LFNDVYNKRLPPSDDDDQPMLSLFNGTGRELFIDHLDGLEVCLKSCFHWRLSREIVFPLFLSRNEKKRTCTASRTVF